MALYNKMRPKTLHDVKGQGKVIDILLNNVRGGNLPNAMLFVGTRGTGKTSVAKIVARLVNCENPSHDGEPCNECDSCKSILSGSSIDVQELDAASNNGVDNIRGIIESLRYKPFGKMKVVILDEVHMLSTGAFNALLKIMEEPPKGVLFILCTTELHKVPATIISRCRKFQFDSISDDVIVDKLKQINEVMGKEAEDEALYLVAQAAKGSMRDAESIYESFLDLDGLITVNYVREHLGFTSHEHVFLILDAIKTGEPMMANAAIDETVERGGSLLLLLEECMKALMDIIAMKMGSDVSEGTASAEYLNKISEYAFSFETQRLFEIADAFGQVYTNKVPNMALSFQTMLIRLSCTQSTITDLMERVSVLEQQVKELQLHGCASVSVTEKPMQAEETTVEEDVPMDVSMDIPIDAPVDPEYVAEYAEAYEKSCQIEDETYALLKEESLVDSGTLPDLVSVETSGSVSDSDAELRALGLTVFSGSSPFEEEMPDASMFNDGAEDSPIPISSSSLSSQSAAPVEQVASSMDMGASFFDDFARLFSK